MKIHYLNNDNVLKPMFLIEKISVVTTKVGRIQLKVLDLLSFGSTSHKKLRQHCPFSKLIHFSQGSIPESLVKKKSEQRVKRIWFQQTLNNF